MEKKHIALLYGGQGREHEVSKMSAAHLIELIDKERYITHPIFIDRSGGWYLSGDKEKPISISTAPPRLMVGGEELRADVIFPMLHGDLGEDGKISGLFECLGIPIVGCHTGAGAVAGDKALTKAVARSLGIPVAKDILLTREDGADSVIKQAREAIGFPMFVKPTDLGSSVGARAAYNEEQLREALSLARSLSARVLIEELIEDKREVECAYLGARSGQLVAPPGEVILDGTYDYEKKYQGGGAVCISRASLDENIIEKIKDYTMRLVRYIGIRQIARVDYFLTPRGIIFNEINTMPGFTSGSLYPKMIEAAGITETELVSELIEGALIV